MAEAVEIYVNEAHRLCEEDRANEAWGIAEMLMDLHPHAASSLVLAAFVAWKMRKFPLAYQLAIRATQLGPATFMAWFRLGISAHELWRADEAEEAFKTALRLARETGERAATELNYSALLVDTGRYQEAEERARRAVELNPSSEKAKGNLALALLGQRKWEGWDLYGSTLRLPGRRVMQYAGEPAWDGTKGKSIVLYGEQGLGDEIQFSSMLGEAIRDCVKVVVDCDEKLAGLFRRSFPKAKVYGTRWKRVLEWDKEDRTPEASLPLGELGRFYRRTDASFPGTAYLVADPVRRSQWRHLFDGKCRHGKKKPVIGIAWTGGMPWTGEKFRTLELAQFKPLFEAVDAHWVSLQYKPAVKEIASLGGRYDLAEYSWATLTGDYDDTAALVAEVDLVVSIQTAVCHLAGALGKECWVLLPAYGQWKYGMTGNVPWYESVRVFRQKAVGDWTAPIHRIRGALRERYDKEKAA